MKNIQEFLYFSVGFATKTTDKLTKLVQKLIEQNKISEAEGKIIVEDYAKKIRTQTEKFDKKLADFVAETMEKLKFAKDEDVNKIQDRINKLEDLLKK